MKQTYCSRMTRFLAASVAAGMVTFSSPCFKPGSETILSVSRTAHAQTLGAEVKKLAEKLKSGDKEKECKAADGVRKLAETNRNSTEFAPVVPVLIERLGKTNCCGFNIGQCTIPEARRNIEGLALIAIGKPSVKPLIEFLGDKKSGWEASVDAARALGRIGDTSAVPALLKSMSVLKSMSDKEEFVGIDAIHALGDLAKANPGNQELLRSIVPPLLTIVEGRKPNLRWPAKADDMVGYFYTLKKGKILYLRPSAIDALGEVAEANLGDKKLIGILVPVFMKALKEKPKDEHYAVREEATEALGKIKDVSAMTELMKALKGRDPDVRSHAAKALGSIGDVRAIPALLASLSDGDEDVRTEVFWALGNVARENPNNKEIAMLIVPSLLKVMNGLADRDVAKAAESLGVILEANPENSELSRAVVPSLLKALGYKNVGVRYKAIEALGRAKSKSAVDSLIEALNDDNLKGIAARALGYIGDKKAVPPLIGMLKDPKTQYDVISALGLLGDPRALPALRGLLSNEVFLNEKVNDAIESITKKKTQK